MRPPWSDGRVAAPGVWRDDVHRVDLNDAFQRHLLGAPFRQQLRAEIRRQTAQLEAQPSLVGLEVWARYRCARLAGLLEANAPKGMVRPEDRADYFHALATGEHWYFDARVATPRTFGPLGWFGACFERWLPESPLASLPSPRPVTIQVDRDGEVPFAQLLVDAWLRHKGPTECVVAFGPLVDPRLVSAFRGGPAAVVTDLNRRSFSVSPTAAEAKALRSYFRRHPTQCLGVSWQPQAPGDSLERGLARLGGVPVSLECTLRLDGEDRWGSLVMTTLDQLIENQARLATLSLEVRNALGEHDVPTSDLLSAQWWAELETFHLVPNRQPRRSWSNETRLVASQPLVVSSRFDLETISREVGGSPAVRAFCFGRGQPSVETARFERRPRARRFMQCVNAPTLVALSPERGSYLHAFDVFRRPRSARAFVSAYPEPEQPRALALLQHMVNADMLRVLS